eukprot:7023329-Pyramimonas_sp.AAC.1
MRRPLVVNSAVDVSFCKIFAVAPLFLPFTAARELAGMARASSDCDGRSGGGKARHARIVAFIGPSP